MKFKKYKTNPEACFKTIKTGGKLLLSACLLSFTNTTAIAQSDIILAPTPTFTQTEFGDKENADYSIDFDYFEEVEGKLVPQTEPKYTYFVDEDKALEIDMTSSSYPSLDEGYTFIGEDPVLDYASPYLGIQENDSLEEIDLDFVQTLGFFGGSGCFFPTSLWVNEGGTIDVLKGDYVGNLSGITNQGTIGKITANFVSNELFDTTLLNRIEANRNQKEYILEYYSDPLTNWVYYGDFIYSSPNSVYRKNLIYNTGKITEGIINSNFVDNTAVTTTPITDLTLKQDFWFEHSTATITTTADLLIGADAANSIFSNNHQYLIPNGENILKKYNTDIFVSNWHRKAWDGTDFEITPVTLTLSAKNGGKLYIDGQINGADYNINITGDETGTVYLDDKISSRWELYMTETNSYHDYDYDIQEVNTPVDISLEHTNLILGKENVLDGNNLTLNSGSISILNNQVGVSNLNNLTIAGDTKFYGDVDLLNSQMDRFNPTTVGNHSGNIIVSGLNLISDATKDETIVPFATEGFRENVVSIVENTDNNAYQTTAYAPIFKYDVSYDPQDGNFLFTRWGSGASGSVTPSNPSQAFNPSVLVAPAAQQSGAQATVNETLRFAFQHADTFTQLPMNVRMSMMNNRYAVLDGETRYQRPNHMHNKGIWVKPFTSFESMDLKNGPKVDAITYGTIIGFDSNFQDFGKGWYGVTSGYVGYNGSLIDYQSVDTTMNGGVVGLTETLYKGKFFTALTATAGASAGSSNTMYGHENFAMLLAGLGSKTGYNFEFQDGKYIIQPVMFLNYTFVNTFDYTNAAGVSIDSDPLHSLQLNPSVRFIANLSNGWQPYASVGMVWNVLNSSKVRANDILLPRMSVKPYVEYGLGLQRSWADRFTAYGQAMVRNGGRNGVMLSAGMRWSLGEDAPIDAI